jgi:hypothetical protein
VKKEPQNVKRKAEKLKRHDAAVKANVTRRMKAPSGYVMLIEAVSMPVEDSPAGFCLRAQFCHMSLWRNGEKVLHRTNVSHDHARALAADLHCNAKELD